MNALLQPAACVGPTCPAWPWPSSCRLRPSGNVIIDQLLDRAKVAAGSTGLEYAILVTQATALKWVNLDSV